MSTRAKLLILVILPVLAVGGFYLRSLVRHAFFKRRPLTEGTARAQLAQAAIEASAGPERPLMLYFPLPSEGKLQVETRSLALAADPSDRIRQIVLALMARPQSPLPPSADLRAVFLAADGTAYLDFSTGAFSGFNPGIQSETLAVYSVVDSLAANLPEVKRVQFLEQGQEVDSLDGHADLTSAFVPDTSRIASVPPLPGATATE